jgi:endoglycosylceramidase
MTFAARLNLLCLTLSWLTLSSSIPLSSTCEAPIRVGPNGILLDACGRARIFRGVNTVAKSFPYIDFSRTTNNDALMWRSLGMNVIRFGIMWNGVFPTSRNMPNETLLSLYAETSSRLYSTAGIYSFLDAHQDGFSPAFCDDGAPPWVAQMCSKNSPGFPMPLAPSLPLDNVTGLPRNCSLNIAWAELYFTYSVGQCFQQLYTNSTDTFASFAEFFEALIAAYANGSDKGKSILAYELLNEPWAGDALENPLLMIPGVADAVNLAPFYGNLTNHIRAVEVKNGLTPKIIAMEPVTWDDIGPSGFSAMSSAWPNSGLELLSYHFYALPDIQGSQEQVTLRAADALRLGAAAILTEYDLGLVDPVNAPYGKLDMRATLNACDTFRHGSIGWDYACVYQGGDGTTMHVPTLRELARPVPLALSGSGNASWSFNATDELSPTFHLVYEHDNAVSEKGGNTTIFLSTGLWFEYEKLNVSVMSDPPGAVVSTLTRQSGRISLPVANETQIPGPVEFDYTILTIGSATPETAIVTVFVSVK